MIRYEKTEKDKYAAHALIVMPAAGYRVRKLKQNLLIVRQRKKPEHPGELSAVGRIGFHSPKVAYKQKTKKTPSAKAVITQANDLLARKTRENGGKAPWSYADRHPTTKHTIDRMDVTKKGTLRVTLAPGTYGDNLRARDVLRGMMQTQVRKLFREENRSRGKIGYAKTFSQLLGASGLLSIGKTFLVIPNRGNTRLYDHFFHVIGGTVESDSKKFRKKPVVPARHALNEIAEETGFSPKNLSFLGRGLRTLKTTRRTIKKGEPIAFARSLEKVDPSAEFVYAIEYRASDPYDFVREAFIETKPGEYQLRNKPKDDEAAYFAIIKFSKKGIMDFIQKNSGRLTPVLRITLEAVLAELARGHKKK